jgi:hypothetical protein
LNAGSRKKIDTRVGKFFDPKPFQIIAEVSIPSPDKNRSFFEQLKHLPGFDLDASGRQSPEDD